MLGKIISLFKKRDEKEIERLEEDWFNKKSDVMAAVLGREHDMVLHSIIPYEIGGALDLYYYPNGIAGTAIATKEVSPACSKGSSNDAFKKYELVMFTRHLMSDDDLEADQGDDISPFKKAMRNISSILNPVARYSSEATLNPKETCEFPEDFDDIGGKCLIFDNYGEVPVSQEGFGVMAVIEIYKSEMQYAMEQGGEMLLSKLKAQGHYPYSDLDREPVV
ncbi:suppressor of fused domain protein [Geomonas oryzisoli]|uniref:Suppressor of fused domain protein n=1 Tax=Geomonas oryzisoli TaxID=2847992 RepID=A0ABX8JCX0_9BACT|nr:suppressor of fused domain protein [Geomonas oryzisoli]QWV95282.1 suppressor of fused domain protein [Geomonas oryzisoli]